MEPPKITLAIPSYGLITTECVISLVDFLTHTDLNIVTTFAQSIYIDFNRNQLVDFALKNGSSHLLFVDSDIQFPVEGLARLLAHDKDIVGGYYNTRRGNNPIRIEGPVDPSTGREGTLQPPDPLPDQLFRCRVLPTGFMLIKLNCLSRLKRPFFATITHERGTIGEDVVFCRNAHDVGIEIYCDPTIPLGHVGKKIY